MSQPKKRSTGGNPPRKAYLVVAGITAPEMRMIEPHEFSKINVDTAYQRCRITGMVSNLIHVLRAGGRFYDPATICERPDGSLYIVDGQQRFWACYECGVPLPALVYRSEGPEAEALLFQAMNERQSVNANAIVKSHQGASAQIIREAASKPDSPYFNQINFGDPGKRPYGAAILIRGMLAVTAGIIPWGRVQDICARTDHALRTEPDGEQRALLFLRLLPLVFPASRAGACRILPVTGLGRVAHERFKHGHAAFPRPSIYERLKKVNWSEIADGQSALKFLPMFEAEVKKIWA